MSVQEVIYADGSHSSFNDGASTHDGGLAIHRLRLISASSALRIYIESGGRMQLTTNGAQLAVTNVIEPITGKRYKRSMNGKREAYADCRSILADIENSAVIYTN